MEISQLIELGFEYVCEQDGLKFFRKRKEVSGVHPKVYKWCRGRASNSRQVEISPAKTPSFLKRRSEKFILKF